MSSILFYAPFALFFAPLKRVAVPFAMQQKRPQCAQKAEKEVRKAKKWRKKPYCEKKSLLLQTKAAARAYEQRCATIRKETQHEQKLDDPTTSQPSPILLRGTEVSNVWPA